MKMLLILCKEFGFCFLKKRKKSHLHPLVGNKAMPKYRNYLKVSVGYCHRILKIGSRQMGERKCPFAKSS